MKYLYYVLCFTNITTNKGCIGKGSLNKTSLGKIKIPIITLDKQNKIITFLDNLYNINGNIKDTIDFYETQNIFDILLNEEFDKYNYLVIAQKFNIKININKISDIGEELLTLQKSKNNILSKIIDKIY